jgi:hypothetical protein
MALCKYPGTKNIKTEATGHDRDISGDICGKKTGHKKKHRYD